MHSSLTLADYVIIAGFFVVILPIGLCYSGRMRDLKTYSAATDWFPGGYVATRVSY